MISDDPNIPGEIEAKQVTRTFQRTDNNGIYDVAIGDEVISSTGNHDYWILDEKLVSVEDLELGSWVIFDDPTTENILESKQVLNISAKEDGSFELQLDDEIVTVKDKEEFWIKDEKWVQAQDLEEGDLLQTEDGDFVTVDGIEFREGTFEVYNFEVEDFHTYFVSQDGVLVHNTNCDEIWDSIKATQDLYPGSVPTVKSSIPTEFIDELDAGVADGNVSLIVITPDNVPYLNPVEVLDTMRIDGLRK